MHGNSMIPSNRGSRLVDWHETLLGAGHNDAPDLLLDVETFKASTIFYGGVAGLGSLKRDVK
jgi:hypothetical protein